jgi:hypothetical protein
MVRMGVGVQDVNHARITGGRRGDDAIDVVRAGIDGQGGAARLVDDQVAETAVALGAERLHGDGGDGGGGRGHGDPPRGVYNHIAICSSSVLATPLARARQAREAGRGVRQKRIERP